MRYIRVREAAEYVGLSKSTLDKMRCFGGGPRFYKPNKAVLYRTDDLDAWMQAKVQADTWSASNDNSVARSVA